MTVMLIVWHFHNLGTLSKDHTRNTAKKGYEKIPYLRTENLKKHTLLHGTYLYSPYEGVPLPGVPSQGYLQRQIFHFSPLTATYLKEIN